MVPFAPIHPSGKKEGITHHAYFAAVALQGILAGSPQTPPDEAAKKAVEHADALSKLLSERLPATPKEPPCVFRSTASAVGGLGR